MISSAKDDRSWTTIHSDGPASRGGAASGDVSPKAATGGGVLRCGLALGLVALSALVFAVPSEAQNNPPVFNPTAVTREFAENTAAGQNVGDPVTATDADTSDTLTYTLGGTDADSFGIVSTSGQIQTKADVTYDHEAKASYSVTVTASDGTATADATVTISVSDVNEPPLAPETPAVAPVPRSTDSLSVSWSAPDNAGRPPVTSYDIRYRENDDDSPNPWTSGPQDVTGTTAMIGSLDSYKAFEAQVRATNAEGSGDWSDTGFAYTHPPVEVIPANHRLVPAGLLPGDRFRALYVTSGTTAATSRNIVDYVQLVSLDPFELIYGVLSEWQWTLHQAALVSMPGVDARHLTDTTWTTADRGMPIYWLNGSKVADDYPDLYDGDWDDEANPRSGLGLPRPLAGTAPWTGSDHDGTELFDGAVSRALGQATVGVGTPGSSASGVGPINGGATFGNSQERPVYGLTQVFRVSDNFRFISNAFLPYTTADLGNDTRSAARSQAFTTGPHATGYGLAGFSANVAPGAQFSANLYTVDATGHPATLLAALSPVSFPSLAESTGGWQFLAAPVGTVLDAATTYALVVEGVGGTEFGIGTINANGGDLQRLAGWSIADVLDVRTGDSWQAASSGDSMVISIFGTKIPDTTAPKLVSATVSSDGTRITAVFDEALAMPAGTSELETFLNGLKSSFAVTVNGTDVPVNSLSRSAATPETLVITLSTAIRLGQSIAFSYTDPTAGDDDVALEDAANNETASFTSGSSDVPDVNNVSTLSVPAAPTGLSATPGNGRVTLRWTAPSSTGGAAITRYEYELDQSGTWTTTGGTATSYTVGNLNNEQSYTFRVRAVNSAGESAPSAPRSATPTGLGKIVIGFRGVSVPEGVVGQLSFPEDVGTAVLTAYLDRSPETALSVPWFSSDDTAVSPDDYTGGEGTLTFAPGETEQTISLQIVDDAIREDPDPVFGEDELFLVALKFGDDYRLKNSGLGQGAYSGQ